MTNAANKLQKHEQVLRQCALFGDIEPRQLFVLLDCLGATERHYRKGEFVLRAGEAAAQVGVLLAGTTHVIQEDYWGNRGIVTHAEPGDLFAESFCCAGVGQLPVSVLAVQACEVLFLDFNRIIDICSSACGFHNALIKNMLQILAQKSVILTSKIEDLTRRTTREKLLSYLSRQALGAGNERFTIPFNRQELADYLSVDRSALSTELAKMQTDGLLRYHKNEFELL